MASSPPPSGQIAGKRIAARTKPPSDSRDGVLVIWSKRIRSIAMADTNSKIAWNRAQLKKNRAMLKRLEIARSTVGHDKVGETKKTIDELARKIAESEKCISAYEQ